MNKIESKLRRHKRRSPPAHLNSWDIALKFLKFVFVNFEKGLLAKLKSHLNTNSNEITPKAWEIFYMCLVSVCINFWKASLCCAECGIDRNTVLVCSCCCLLLSEFIKINIKNTKQTTTKCIKNGA